MKHFNHFFSHELKQKLQQTRRLEKTIHAALPPEYREHVHIGDIENGTLTLIVSNPAIASNLRFQVSGLQQKICDRHDIVVRRTKIRLSPLQPRQQNHIENKTVAPREISVEERENRERLRNVLKRL